MSFKASRAAIIEAEQRLLERIEKERSEFLESVREFEERTNAVRDEIVVKFELLNKASLEATKATERLNNTIKQANSAVAELEKKRKETIVKRGHWG